MIKQELKELGILATNLGSSTGQNWFATGADITSSSPVDGQVIATVTCSSHNDYKDICAQA